MARSAGMLPTAHDRRCPAEGVATHVDARERAESDGPSQRGLQRWSVWAKVRQNRAAGVHEHHFQCRRCGQKHAAWSCWAPSRPDSVPAP